jgi:molybdopterin-containing oxidoreductase family iron-sulfur binding subunit
MPGLHHEAVVLHRGNGRGKGVNKVTDGYGVNPSPLFAKKLESASQQPITSAVSVKLSATGKVYRLAAIQKHNDIANRTDIVKKMTVADATARMGKAVNLDDAPDLYPKLKQADYRWGMAIDLTACTGCGACTTACSLENNVPQVGRQQILLGREMFWIRIDRYFAGPVDNPEVSFQPMLCQHCNHAPCEAVCPVYATTHDFEGMNAQTYNRCVGTRYCANACPYKIRRFNWFTHKWNVVGDREQDRSLRALNPDVTIRTRGVMEKCTFCVQRIRDGKHRAKERGDLARDGEIKSACQQVCPANAIVFGNLKDERSMVSRLRTDGRAYLALNGDPEHKHYGIKTWPNVSYLAEVTHKPSAMNAGQHHGGGGHDHEAKKDEHGS